MRKLLKSKKALSPVVAAIILIAVTVAVSIAVAAWMGSMTFTFMETEQLTITSMEFSDTGLITVNGINSGADDIVIADVKLTGNGISSYVPTLPMTFDANGADQDLTIQVTGNLYAGNTYTVELITTKSNHFAYSATSDVTYTTP
jgi:flagellin-like protein